MRESVRIGGQFVHKAHGLKESPVSNDRQTQTMLLKYYY